ncbi:MAG: DoxX family protein [Planctomycetota bacterium JB042]
MSAWTFTPADGASKGLLTTLLVLRVLVAAFFVFLAIKNLAGDAQMSADFRRWGYPDGFRVLTALLQVAGAALLLFTPIAFFGAALLACVLCGAVWTHFRHDPAATMLQPAIVLIPVLVFLVAYRPAVLR